MLKRIAPLFIALLCIVGFAPSALAGGSGPQPSATVNGDSVTVTTTGCDPASSVSAELTKDGATVATKTGTASGTGDASIVFSGLSAGTYSAEVTCNVGGTPRTQVLGNLVVQAASATTVAAGGALPDTGSDSSLPLARLGIVLVAAGGVAIFAGQKRRSMMRIDA